MERLDRTKDYGIIYGEPKYAYEQDGVHYGPDGTVIEKWTTPELIAQGKALAQKRKAREQALAERREEREKRRRITEEL